MGAVISLNAYAGTRVGKAIFTDPECGASDPPQCVALANDWCCANGWPRPRGATAASLSFPPGWVQVDSPQSGDLVVWGAALPGSNGDGHIDIYYSGSGRDQFTGLDQNWPTAAGLVTELIAHDTADTRFLQAVWRFQAPPQEVDPLAGFNIQNLKIELLRSTCMAALGRFDQGLLDQWSAAMADDGHNWNETLGGIWDSPESLAYRAGLAKAITSAEGR